MKVCNTCFEEKPLEEFIKSKECKEGRAGKCKKCGNEYNKKYKRDNSKRLAALRRKRYAETNGVEVKEREEARKKAQPLRFRCQVLRQGMRERSRLKGREFDVDFFTVNYLMKRLSNNPKCECCNTKLDTDYKKDRKFNDKSPSMDRVDPDKGYIKGNVAILCWRCNKHKQSSSAVELRMIADFMDSWGLETGKF